MSAGPASRPGGHFAPGGLFAGGAPPVARPPPRFAPPAPRRTDDAATVAEALAVAARAEAAASNAPRAEADAGEVFLALPRTDGTELRVSLHFTDPVQRKGPWVRVAPWLNGWPVKGKGAALRVRELAAVVVALGRIISAAEGSGAPALAAGVGPR